MIKSLTTEVRSIVGDIGEGVFHHSYSSVRCFCSDCKLKYFFRYIDRLPQERVGVALVFGSAVNAALLSIDTDLAKGRPINTKAAIEALQAHLRMAFANKEVPVATSEGETLDSLTELGKRLLEAWVAERSLDEVPLALERRFTVPLFDGEGRILPRPLTGEIDRWVKLKDGRIGIDDWKTSKSKWSEWKVKKDDQITAYMIGGTHLLGRRPDFGRYQILVKTKSPYLQPEVAVRTDHHVRRFVKKVSHVDIALKSGAFPPNDEAMGCGKCEFRNACSKWQDS